MRKGCGSLSDNKKARLSEAYKNAMTYARVIVDMTYGMSEAAACHKHGMDQARFRRYISQLDLVPDNTKKEIKEDRIMTVVPAFKIYMQVFNVSVDDVPYDVTETMDAAMKTLSTKEQEVLHLRYYAEMTLDETAKRLGVTRERIRQIEAKALRKLRQPGRRVILQKGMAYYKKEQEYFKVKYEQKVSNDIQEIEESIMDAIEYNDRERVLDMRNRLNEMLADWGMEEEKPQAVDMDKVKEMEIRELHLNTRTVNALTRTGIRTVEDLMGKTYEDLMRIRNLGINSVDQVVDECQKLGISIKMGNV